MATRQEKGPGLTSLELPLKTTLLVIGYFLLLFALLGYAYYQKASIVGPELIKAAPDGTLFIEFDRHLYHYGRDGNLIVDYDMAALGAGELFDFTFLGAGTILLRLGPVEYSTVDHLKHYARMANEDEVLTSDADSGLFACVLAEARCVRFSPFDSDRPHWLLRDPASGAVYVADTTRHAVRKLGPGGNEVAVRAEGLYFPNALVLDGDTLLLVDTNHHRIVRLATATERFAEELQAYDPLTDAARAAGHTWPYQLAAVGSEWWLVLMDNNMAHGGVYRFDADWQALGVLSLPEGADPVYVATVGDEVLVSDFANQRIYRFDPEGRSLGLFAPAPLEQLLEKNRRFSERWQQAVVVLLVFVALSLLLGLVLGVRQVQQAGRSLQMAEQSVAVELDSPALHWLPRSREAVRARRSLFIALPLFLLLSLAALLFAVPVMGWRQALPLLVLLPVALLALVPLLLSMRSELGVMEEGGVIVVRRGRRYQARPVAQSYYSGTHLLVGRMAVPVHNQLGSVWALDELVKYLYPLLGEARLVSPREMLALRAARRRPAGR